MTLRRRRLLQRCRNCAGPWLQGWGHVVIGPSLQQCLLVLFITSCRGEDVMGQEAVYPAFFTFGDSLVDNGNNNYLASLARADFPPNGCDYGDGYPTGRFCNGKTLSDYIGLLLGVDPPPAYFDCLTLNHGLEKGVNFASGAAGILDESGYNYLERIPMSQQVEYFELVKQSLIRELGPSDVDVLLHKALYLVVLGSNDFINNYLLPGAASRLLFSPDSYADLLVDTYCQHIKSMYNIGARKFILTSAGPLGCLPYEKWQLNSTTGACLEEPNRWVQSYNAKIQVAMRNMTLAYPGLYLLFGNAYDKVYAYSQAPEEFGFLYGNVSCCGRGLYAAEAPCIPTTPFCDNRAAYVFWDRFHPSDQCNLLIADLFVSGGPPDVTPMNLLQLAAL